MTDLLEHPELVPENVKLILDSLEDDTYAECMRVETELKALGYKIDWYLDAEPHSLQMIS